MFHSHCWVIRQTWSIHALTWNAIHMYLASQTRMCFLLKIWEELGEFLNFMLFHHFCLLILVYRKFLEKMQRQFWLFHYGLHAHTSFRSKVAVLFPTHVLLPLNVSPLPDWGYWPLMFHTKCMAYLPRKPASSWLLGETAPKFNINKILNDGNLLSYKEKWSDATYVNFVLEFLVVLLGSRIGYNSINEICIFNNSLEFRLSFLKIYQSLKGLWNVFLI